MAKLVENTFRFINISFVNEMALLCDKLGVNVWEVIEAARSKPFAFMPHFPSAGVGGDCIPVVPLYLDASARDHGMRAELIQAAEHINDAMPILMVDKLAQALSERGKALDDSTVLLVGVTYKPDIADLRESAALRVFAEAERRGAVVHYHDPLIPTLLMGNRQVSSTALTPDMVRAMDAVVLLTGHKDLDYPMMLQESHLIIDTGSGLNPRVGPNVVNVWVPAGGPQRVALLA